MQAHLTRQVVADRVESEPGLGNGRKAKAPILQRGSFGIGAPTSAVLEVGGAPPEDFETIVRRYVTHSPYAKRSLRLTAPAIRNLAKVVLTPAPNVADLLGTLNIPNIGSGRLAADSPNWHGSHKPPANLAA